MIRVLSNLLYNFRIRNDEIIRNIPHEGDFETRVRKNCCQYINTKFIQLTFH